jgi:hypothetical protein
VSGNSTLNQPYDFGDLDPAVSPRAEAVGTVGDGPAGAADVNWYTFELTGPAQVTLTTLDRPEGSPFVSVLTLYKSDPFDIDNPTSPTYQRLLAQSDGATLGGDAFLAQTLGPGTYAVAVSGSGNRYFHPYLVDSGYYGSTGPYGLLLTTAPAGFADSDGPHVVAANPAPGAVLTASPLNLRLDFSTMIDQTTVNPDSNSGPSSGPGSVLPSYCDIRLVYNATG